VPGGTYSRTYTNPGDGGTGEADPATVTGFRLDKYLVTVGRFRRYVNYVTSSAGSPPTSGQGKHTHLNGGAGLTDVGSTPNAPESGWDATDWNSYIPSGTGSASTWNTNLACNASFATWTPSPGSNENLPIDCVNWYEAYAFCIWDGGFLPSEAEWEYAAAGGTQQRAYPWGSTDPGTANQYAIYDCYYGGGSCSSPSTAIAPVGTPSSGVGRWGQLDLAGDMNEWNLDYWFGAFYDPCTDCANLTATTAFRIMRGGYFDSNPTSYLDSYYRGIQHPETHFQTTGLRCARTP
jgi:formylglycine-generating enzyme required for sulfatase activity